MNKEIKAYRDDEIILYCSAIGCKDKLVVSVDKKFAFNEDYAYFEIVYDEPYNLWQRILKAWRFIRGWGEDQLAFDGIFLDADQALELGKILTKRASQFKKSQRKTIYNVERKLQEKTKEIKDLKKELEDKSAKLDKYNKERDEIMKRDLLEGGR